MNKQRMKRILMVHNYYQLAGGEDTVFENEKKLLEDHGYRVFLYTRDNNEMKDFSILHKLILPFVFLFNVKTYRDIKNIIKKEHIDIVHVHNTLALISPSVFYAAVKCKTPIIQTLHNFRMMCPNGVFFRKGRICEDCVEKGLWSAIKNKCYRNSRLETSVLTFSIWFHRRTGIWRNVNFICLTEFNKEKMMSINAIGSAFKVKSIAK